MNEGDKNNIAWNATVFCTFSLKYSCSCGENAAKKKQKSELIVVWLSIIQGETDAKWNEKGKTSFLRKVG